MRACSLPSEPTPITDTRTGCWCFFVTSRQSAIARRRVTTRISTTHPGDTTLTFEVCNTGCNCPRVEAFSYIATALVAYLLGSIPTGYLVAKSRGIDIRTVGSGNIGAT